MDINKVQQLKCEDPSEETLTLTNRRKELAKPGDYRLTNVTWRKYNPPKFHRAEIKHTK